jgi:glycosyltransferase involved in cell wall biosynthesis
MKRVAIIVPGGIGNGKFLQGVPSMVNLIERLSHDFEITVYSFQPEVDEPLAQIKTEIKEVSKNFKLKSIPTNIKLSSWIKALLLLFRFLIDYTINRYDLVHAFWVLPAGLISVKLSKIFNIPCIVTLQGGETANLPEINYGNIIAEKSKKRTLEVCKKADKLVVLTNFQLTQLRLIGVHREDIDIIPYGVEEKLFPFNKTQNFTEPYNFIHVANLTEVKDQETLIKVFKIISEKLICRLTIIGDDFLQNKIQKLVQDLELKNVLFVGAVPHQELNKYLADSHFMLHTSLHEAQAVVINEAMSSGVVVCGTRVGLIYDLTDDLCISTDCGDYTTLAEKILELISDKEGIEKMRTSAYNWSVNHSASWTYELYKKNYEKLTNN